MLKFKSVSEAYSVIPKSQAEIDDLTHLSDPQKEKLKGLYAYITQNTGMADPLALSTIPKRKVSRLHVLLQSISISLTCPKNMVSN